MNELHFIQLPKKDHLQVCKLILENVDDKNPKKKDEWTPLHIAVKNCHLEVFKLILENVVVYRLTF